MPRILIGIGSNQQRQRHVRAAIRKLLQCFPDLAVSSVYETVAVGFQGDPFFNLVAAFTSEQGLSSLLDTLRAIEEECGRKRGEKRFGPRSLDIDLLAYGDEICDGEPVEIPRSDILTAAYVLIPLAELAPHSQHPVLGESYAALLNRLKLDTTGVRRCSFDPLAQIPATDPGNPP